MNKFLMIFRNSLSHSSGLRLKDSHKSGTRFKELIIDVCRLFIRMKFQILYDSHKLRPLEPLKQFKIKKKKRILGYKLKSKN